MNLKENLSNTTSKKMSIQNTLKWGVTLLTAFLATPTLSADLGLCKFSTETMQFRGTTVDQTNCLLRKVKPQGAGSTAQKIPKWLLDNVGRDTSITPKQMSTFLITNRIQPSHVGGIVSHVDLTRARYFVIHDTSSPAFATFPADINDSTWSGNDLHSFKTREIAKKINIVTNRVGESMTLQDLSTERQSPATKLEESGVAPKSKNYFIHVENVQPREKPAGSWPWVAPTPGFTPPQINRLALIYVVSSVRAGHWLTPAYHFNIDSRATSREPHDDPQGFNLDDWITAVSSIVTNINSKQESGL